MGIGILGAFVPTRQLSPLIGEETAQSSPFKADHDGFDWKPLEAVEFSTSSFDYSSQFDNAYKEQVSHVRQEPFMEPIIFFFLDPGTKKRLHRPRPIDARKLSTCKRSNQVPVSFLHRENLECRGSQPLTKATDRCGDICGHYGIPFAAHCLRQCQHHPEITLRDAMLGSSAAHPQGGVARALCCLASSPADALWLGSLRNADLERVSQVIGPSFGIWGVTRTGHKG